MPVSYVYILSNRSKSTYVGVTSDLFRRVWQHRYGLGSEFTAKYNIDRLVWFEESGDIRNSISREKRLKNWRREWKSALVERSNPDWLDLAEDWFDSKEILNQVQDDG